jgi:hypothetical protein
MVNQRMNGKLIVNLYAIKFCVVSVFVFCGTDLIADTRGFDLKLGAYVSTIDYKEDNRSSHDGSFFGLVARYSSYNSSPVVLLDLTYTRGSLDYKGEGKINGIESDLYDIRGMFGGALYLENYRLTPYFGVGVRHSIADSRSYTSTTSITGYKSEQTYLYNPIGIEILEIKELGAEGAWVTGWRFELDNVLYARNRTRLGSDDGFKQVNISQNGYGYRFYISFSRFLNEDGSGIVIEPFYKYWNISDTDNDEYPSFSADHKSSEWGVGLMVSF